MFWTYSFQSFYSKRSLLFKRAQIVTVIESNDGLAGLERGTIRDGFPAFSLHVGPAAAVSHLLHLGVSGITIRYQATCKTPQETLRALAAPIGLVLKDLDWCFATFSAGIDLNRGFRSRRLSILLRYLNHSFVGMDHILLQQSILHVLVQRLQTGLTALNHSVGHGRLCHLHALSPPDLVLTSQSRFVGVLLRHYIGHRGRRNWSNRNGGTLREGFCNKCTRGNRFWDYHVRGKL